MKPKPYSGEAVLTEGNAASGPKVDGRRALCNTLLHKLIRTPRKMEKWWDRPNEFFKLKTPNQVWETTPHLVVDYLLKKVLGNSNP